MNYVRLMQHGEGYATVSPIQPGMSLVRGQDHSEVGNPVCCRIRVQDKTPGHAQSLDRLGAQRGGPARAGERPVGDWPGKEYGIRRPDPWEIPLTWGEVNCFRNMGARL